MLSRAMKEIICKTSRRVVEHRLNNIRDADKKSCKTCRHTESRNTISPRPNFQNPSLSPPRRGCVSRSNPVNCSATVRPVKYVKNDDLVVKNDDDVVKNDDQI